MPALGFLVVDALPIGYLIGTIIAVFMDFGTKSGTAAWFFGPCLIFGVLVSAMITALLALKLRTAVIDDMVVNMVDVGEETGELDTMLYKWPTSSTKRWRAHRSPRP